MEGLDWKEQKGRTRMEGLNGRTEWKDQNKGLE